MIEDWLLKNEEYKPENDKNGFINKSLMSFSKLVKRIRRNRMGDSFIYRVTPVVKFIAVIITNYTIS